MGARLAPGHRRAPPLAVGPVRQGSALLTDGAGAPSWSHSGTLSAPHPPMPPIKTYIVEDSPLIRESLIATLEELLPVSVVGWAEDEAGALAWLTRAAGPAVDLVIIDIFLKSGSGLGLLRAARQLPVGPRLVVLSNYATADIRRRCLALGAHRVFDKSHEIDALIQYCSGLVAGEAGESGHGRQA